MTRDADLRQHALELLEQAKKFLEADGELDPTAFIITRNDQVPRPIGLRDEASKVRSCKKILNEARKLHARAIITLLIARSKDFDHEKFEEETYSWGDLQRQGAERCILLTLSGPGIKNWVIAVPFVRRAEKVNFGKEVEFGKGVDIGLFPGWSDQIGDPRVS